MNLAGLSFDNIPPLHVPLRFFITAPLFGILAGILIISGGDALWGSRWQPATLALTHSLTLGVITMTMAGALLQLLPVLTGQGVTRVKLLASVTHGGLVAGTLALLGGFLHFQPMLFAIALACLLLSLLSYILSLAHLLFRRLTDKASLNAMRLGLLAFTLTLALGCLLLANYLWPQSLGLGKDYTDLHLGWGLAGWVALLIMAVSYQVIPMFHVAPAFPRWSSRYLPLALFALLVLKLLLQIFAPGMLAIPLVELAIKACLAAYAVAGITVLYQRKRKIPDTTINCWYLAYGALLVAIAINLVPEGLWPGKPPLLEGALWIFAFVITVITGMLLKIVPFLSYLHLQQFCGLCFQAMPLLPNMHQLLSQAQANWLWRLHLATLASLMLTLWWPIANPLLGGLVIGQFGYLFWLLLGVLRQYRDYHGKIAAVKAEHETPPG